MDAPILDEGQKVGALNDAVLRLHGITLPKDARVLDFGCGSGRHTYEYLDAGYDRTIGFDVKDYVRLRGPEDRKHFSFPEAEGSNRIPFPDDTFDFITSTSVFEHVLHPAEVIPEIGRVLKPDGATLHVFPSRWRLVEPHIHVPFGGAIQSRPWLSFWAHMGVRNEFQAGLSAQETASRNAAYCETGIHYLTSAAIERLWWRHFASVAFADRAFLQATRDVSTVSRVALPLAKALPALLPLYRTFHTCVVLARGPADGPSTGIG
ncbi:MAG: class I SAM-dependent methyltransferase [Alphaproteobacteria bacterium]|nr:class I SAM-dependent methyltransferase [Alphaproteobacteria bacterium]